MENLTDEQKAWLIAEKETLSKVIDSICQKVKERVISKAEQGFSGWDNYDKIVRRDLFQKMAKKVNGYNYFNFDKVSEKDMLDIIAFAAFLINTNPKEIAEKE